jgi:anti-anti-sigma factor
VELGDDCDSATAPALRTCLAGCLSEGFTDINVDMTDLEFIDSAGVRPLVWTGQQLRGRAGRLVVQNPPSWAQDLLAITGLTPFLPLDSGPPP